MIVATTAFVARAQPNDGVDGGAWYWLDDLWFHLGLNARFGVAEQNRELRALYISIGGRQIF